MEEHPGNTISPIVQGFHHLHQSGVEGEEMLRDATFEEQDLIPAIAGWSKHAT